MSDLIGQLKCCSEFAKDSPDDWTHLNPAARTMLKEAAEEIERLREALKQIAREGCWPQIVDGADFGDCMGKIAVEMRQTARAALGNPQ